MDQKILNIFKKNKNTFFILISFFSLYISFFLNEDGHGAGATGDFRDTWGYIEELKKKQINEVNPLTWTRHFPLHYYLVSLVNLFIENQNQLRFFYCSISFLIPFFFYKIILLKKNRHNYESLIFLICIIFFIPAYRYLSIWANAHITAYIFFLISIFYFYKYKFKNQITYLILHIFFIFLTIYTIQYYAIFAIYLFFQYFEFKFKYKNLFILFLILVLSIPGLYFISIFPDHILAAKTSSHLPNIILGNTAMISLYTVPIFLINFYFNKNIFIKKILFNSIIFSILTLLFSLIFFDNTKWIIGGGIPLAISNIIFQNYIFFFIASFFGIFTLTYLSYENYNNLFLSFILVFIFQSSTTYQRYYEPLVFLLLFVLYNSNLVNVFEKNYRATFVLLIYYIIYYIFASSEFLYVFR